LVGDTLVVDVEAGAVAVLVATVEAAPMVVDAALLPSPSPQPAARSTATTSEAVERAFTV
jgi:hypothetical protein